MIEKRTLWPVHKRVRERFGPRKERSIVYHDGKTLYHGDTLEPIGPLPLTEKGRRKPQIERLNKRWKSLVTGNTEYLIVMGLGDMVHFMQQPRKKKAEAILAAVPGYTEARKEREKWERRELRKLARLKNK